MKGGDGKEEAYSRGVEQEEEPRQLCSGAQYRSKKTHIRAKGTLLMRYRGKDPNKCIQ